MTNLLHHILLVSSAAALVTSGVRVGSVALPSGLLRVVGAGVLTAAFAAVEAMLLGATGIGLRPVPLAAAAALTWIVTVRACPPPRLGVVAELGAWWNSAGPAARIGLGAGFGASVVSIAYGLHRPALGPDALLYHLPVTLAFVQDGGPTGMPAVMDHLPVEAYPFMYELLSAWAVGVSHSLVAFSLVPVALLALTAVAGYAGLRELRVAPTVAGLAAAAVTLAPQAAGWQLTGAVTDPAALCWVTCCGALCAVSLRRPEAYPLALVAAALAIATKLTAVPLALTALVLAGVAVRGRLLRAPRALAAGAALAGFIGLFVYVRNLIRFGSPFWPFYTTPWGDPVPDAIRLNASSFFEHPRANLRWLSHGNLSHFAGPLLLLAAGVVAPILSRTRAVLVASAVTLGSVALWTRAPFTGINENVYPSLDPPATPLSTVRYLLPGLAAAATAVALASRGSRTRERIIGGLLAAVVAIDVVQAQTEIGAPEIVPIGLLALGGAGGALVAAAAGGPAAIRWVRDAAGGRELRWLSLTGLGLAGACALALAAPGYADRHTSLGGWQSDIVRWFDSRPGYAGGDAPVTGVGLRPGLLAGPELEHHVGFVGADADCREVTRRTIGAWVVVFDWGRIADRRGSARCLASRRPALSKPPFSIYAPDCATSTSGPRARCAWRRRAPRGAA